MPYLVGLSMKDTTIIIKDEKGFSVSEIINYFLNISFESILSCSDQMASKANQPIHDSLLSETRQFFRLYFFLVSLYHVYLSLIPDSDSKQYSNTTVIEGSRVLLEYQQCRNEIILGFHVTSQQPCWSTEQ